MGHYGEDERTNGAAFPRTIISLMLILCGIMVCMVTLLVSVDTACNISIDHALPVYPGSQEISAQYDFLRPRGMGNSFVIFQTPDDVTTVRRWYGDYQSQLIRENGAASGRPGIARTRYQIVEGPDGKGTRIYLISMCAYG